MVLTNKEGSKMTHVNNLAEDLIALHDQIKFVMEKHKEEMAKVEASTEPFDWTLSKDMQELKGGMEEAIRTYDLYAGSDLLSGKMETFHAEAEADHIYENSRDMD